MPRINAANVRIVVAWGQDWLTEGNPASHLAGAGLGIAAHFRECSGELPQTTPARFIALLFQFPLSFSVPQAGIACSWAALQRTAVACSRACCTFSGTAIGQAAQGIVQGAGRCTPVGGVEAAWQKPLAPSR